MKKAWDPSTAPIMQPPSFDGVVLSHNESDELMDDGLRPLSALQAADMKAALPPEEGNAIHQRDLGFGHKLWVCPVVLLEKSVKPVVQAHRGTHLKLAHG